MLTIYGYPTFNPLKTVITAEELGLNYEYVHVNLAKRQNLTPEHLARHPYGKVPVMIDGDLTLSESNTICRYLSRISDNRLYSTDPKTAGKIDEVIDLITLQAGKSLSECFWEELIVPQMGGTPDDKKISSAKKNLEKQLPYFDNLLSENQYLTGNTFTLADIIAYTYVGISDITSVDISHYQNLERWFNEVKTRDSVRKAKLKMGNK